MTDEAQDILARYRHIEDELRFARSDKSKAEQAVKVADARIARLKPWLEELKGGVCPGCNGYGYLREFVAQDEVRAVTCTSCDGVGIKRPNASLSGLPLGKD